ncbi:MAG: GH116 family glycosyl-hydrolase [Armatimonadota bacterium]
MEQSNPRPSSDTFEQWSERIREEMARPPEQTVYSGEALRALALPIGGIGAGNCALAGDGTLRQWQIFNQVNHTAFLPGTFFGVRAQSGRRAAEPMIRLLQTDCFYDQEFEPALSTSDHVIPDEARRMAERGETVDDIRFVGEYPIAELSYVDDELPVEVSVEAFSPLIPLNSKDSGLPCAIFIFSVENPTDSRAEVTLFGSLQNAVGYDAGSGISGVRCPCYGGNVNRAERDEMLSAVAMTNPSLPDDHPGQGSMAIAALSDAAQTLERWTDFDALWQGLRDNGRLLPASPAGASPDGATWNGAVAVSMSLEPGETRREVFVITWHFPNHYVNWDQRGFGVKDTKSKFWLGNAYNNWFDDAMDVLHYVRDDFERLVRETRSYRDTIYDSTLPYWFIDRVTSQAATVRTPTCLWNEDGRFHGFEGSRGAVHGAWGIASGCCPLNCTHVWNYEMMLSRLFPDLERTMRQTDLGPQMREDGGIIFRTVLPLYLPRWEIEGEPFERTNVACDGHWGTLLKVCREWQQSGDDEFLEEMWPEVTRAVEFGFAEWDADGDGVLDGPQWNTFDLYFHGHNTYCSLLYLAALLAVEEMARHLGEAELAEECRNRFDRGSEKIDDTLFNGEYYEQHFDESTPGAEHHQYGKGCLSDQLFGQWWAHTLDLGHLLDAGNVRSALEAIYQHNFRHDLADHVQRPRVYASEWEKGLIITTWPHGGRQETAMLYADEVWSSLEFELAGLMIREGLTERAMHLIRAACDRHDGRYRNPWNEIECGDHYVRPMCSWYMLEAAGGRTYHAPKGLLGFDPKITPERFRSFFITAEGWGSYGQRREGSTQTSTLSVEWGTLNLRTLRLGLPEVAGEEPSVAAYVGGAEESVKTRVEDAQLFIEWPEGLELAAGGEDLSVRVEW